VKFDGLYEFRVMPFGLCNVPATFPRLMQRVLTGMSKFCSVYIDDILDFSESVEEHIGRMCLVFHRLYEVDLKLHPQKCFLAHPEGPYLGHVISAEGYLPTPGKVLAVKKFPTPTNVIAFREFLGWIVVIGVHCPILPSRLDHSSCWQEVMFHFCGQNPVWKLQKLEGATHVTRSAGIP